MNQLCFDTAMPKSFGKKGTYLYNTQQRKLVVSLALEAAAAAFLKLSLFSTTGNKQLGAPTTRTPSAATSQQVETVQ